MRLGIAEPDMELSAIRSLLERAVPKNRGQEFGDLLEELANDTCVAVEPDCPRCELRKGCPTAATRKEEAAAAAKQAAALARASAKAKTKATEKKAPEPAEVKPAAKSGTKSAQASAVKKDTAKSQHSPKGRHGGVK
jgi:endonuclease-3